MEVLVAYIQSKDFDIEFCIQVAILHDVLEDTNTEYQEFKKQFGEQIADAVLALTKDESITLKKEKMIDSLNRINALKKEVGIVKIADRITNLQKPLRHWKKDKISNYLRGASIIAKALNNKNNYLNKSLIYKISE